LVLALSACSSLPSFSDRAKGFAAGFRGGVAGDEPRAVVVAQQIMADGGSAADAAVAAYFAMSVTLPSAASLGGGGACLVADQKKKTVESLIFTHDGRSKVLAPANARAMYALHAKYGQLPWRQLVAPAEGLARFGFTISMALANRMAASKDRILASPGLRLVFTDTDGQLLKAGDKLRQIDLSYVLSVIRRKPRSVFQGRIAKLLAAAYTQAGMPMSVKDIIDTKPSWRPPLSVKRRNQLAEFPPTPAGVVAAQMWAALYREGHWRSADSNEKPHLMAEVTRRAFADAGRVFQMPDPAISATAGAGFITDDRVEALMAGFDDKRRIAPSRRAAGQAPSRDHGSASIVTADRSGQAVACAFTMNRPMGAGQLIPRTGIIMAAAPDHLGAGVAALSLMSLRTESQQQLEYIGAATGGGVSPVALVTSALQVMIDDKTLETAQKSLRLYNGAMPDEVVVEDSEEGRKVAKTLTAKGHKTTLKPALGRLNAFTCPAGFEGRESKCEIRTDPRGFGFAEGR
jgi:gamma-glutamyltranspeptidase/glutathione hydrolase